MHRPIRTLGAITLACAVNSAAPAADPAAVDRHGAGLATLNRISGERALATLNKLEDIAPALGDWIVDFAYGEVLSRPALDLRTRELATVAALTALGNAGPQLRAHIHGALNVGCKPEEIVEVILQMTAYAGFPASLNGITAAQEVFAERGVSVSSVR